MSRLAEQLKKVFRSRLFRVFVLVSFTLTVRWLDLAGWDSFIAHEAEIKLERFYGGWHPGGGLCSRDCDTRVLGRDQVSVVLIHDEDVLGTPDRRPTYVQYAAMIDRLAEHGAKVVVFDMAIPVKPDLDPGPLLKALAAARTGGLSVVLGRIMRQGDVPIVCADGSRRLAGEIAPALVCAASAVAPIGWYAMHKAGYYPLRVEWEGGTGSDATPGVLAAKMLAGPQSSLVLDLADRDRDMFLAWGHGTPPIGGRCEPSTPDAGRGVLERGLASIEAILHGANLHPSTCPYLPTMAATGLAAPVGAAAWAEADRLVRGRAVFVGVMVAGTNDSVETPAGQVVPGVYKHATAAENLLTLGAKGYPVYEPPTGGVDVPSLLIASAIALALALRVEARKLGLFLAALARVRFGGVQRTDATVAPRVGWHAGLHWLIVEGATLFGMAILLIVVAFLTAPLVDLDNTNTAALFVIAFGLEVVMEITGKMVELVARPPEQVQATSAILLLAAALTALSMVATSPARAQAAEIVGWRRAEMTLYAKQGAAPTRVDRRVLPAHAAIVGREGDFLRFKSSDGTTWLVHSLDVETTIPAGPPQGSAQFRGCVVAGTMGMGKECNR